MGFTYTRIDEYESWPADNIITVPHLIVLVVNYGMCNLVSRYCTENKDFKCKKGNEELKILNDINYSNYTLITYTSV